MHWSDAPEGPNFAVIGDPVDHSLSPQIHNAWMREARIHGEYYKLQVRAGEVLECLEVLGSKGFVGVNVTAPLKQEAEAACNSSDWLSKMARSTNCIAQLRLEGYNTDAPGVWKLAEFRGVDTPFRALVLGAGASGRAIALWLAFKGVQVVCWNRTPKPYAVHESMPVEWLSSRLEYRGFDWIVQATAMDMESEELNWACELGETGSWAVDLRYRKGQESAWLCCARQMGLVAEDGIGVLAAQAALSWTHWSSEPRHWPSIDDMLRAVQ